MIGTILLLSVLVGQTGPSYCDNHSEEQCIAVLEQIRNNQAGGQAGMLREVIDNKIHVPPSEHQYREPRDEGTVSNNQIVKSKAGHDTTLAKSMIFIVAITLLGIIQFVGIYNKLGKMRKREQEERDARAFLRRSK